MFNSKTNIACHIRKVKLTMTIFFRYNPLQIIRL